MKNNKKIIKIVSIVLIAIFVVGLATFLSIFLYRRNNPEMRYALADKRWEEASGKISNDDIAINMQLGSGEDALNVNINIAGQRVYDNEIFRCDYEVIVQYTSMSILTADLDISFDGENYNLSFVKKEGFIDFENINYQKKAEDINSVVSINLEKNIIYDDNSIVIDKEGSYYIDGKYSVHSIINELLQVLNQQTGTNYTEQLDSWTNFGKIRGQVIYDDKLNFESITSLQDISIFVPWAEIDEINNTYDFPQSVEDIITARKIIIEDVPLLGDYTINFNSICPSGLDLSIKISISSEYTIE